MKTISLKKTIQFSGEDENSLIRVKKPRNREINEVILYYNKPQREQIQ